MAAFRFVIRLVLILAFVVLPVMRADAEGHVLNGQPVSLVKAQTWCIAPGQELPSWNGPAHPECEMVWRVLAEHGDRILYSARYAWPSPTRGDGHWRMLTEILYEGVKRARVVTALYAVQEDEATILPAPLRVFEINGATAIESRVCMSDTTECGSEFAIWREGRVSRIANHTVAEIRARLPRGYDLHTTPQIDLASLTGKGSAARRTDPDCCPSATVAFKLQLDGTELHLGDMEFRSGRTRE